MTRSAETKARIRAGAARAVAAGHWPAPGPLWTPAEDAALGTAPDAEIAARLGRSRGSVAARRHKLGIASPAKRGRPPGSVKRRSLTENPNSTEPTP